MALAGLASSFLFCMASARVRGADAYGLVAVGLFGGLPVAGLFIDWVRTHEPDRRLAVYVGVTLASFPVILLTSPSVAMTWYAVIAVAGMFLWWNDGARVVHGHIVDVRADSLLVETSKGMIEVDRSLHEWLTHPSPVSLVIGAPLALDAETRSIVAGEGPFRSVDRCVTTDVREVGEDVAALERSRAARAGLALQVALSCAFTHCVASWIIQQATCPH